MKHSCDCHSAREGSNLVTVALPDMMHLAWLSVLAAKGDNGENGRKGMEGLRSKWQATHVQRSPRLDYVIREPMCRKDITNF